MNRSAAADSRQAGCDCRRSGQNPPFIGHQWLPHSGHLGTPTFHNSIVNREFFANLDVSRGEIDAVEFFP